MGHGLFQVLSPVRPNLVMSQAVGLLSGCTRQWLSVSAASQHQQIGGHVMLQQVGVQHGIMACQHRMQSVGTCRQLVLSAGLPTCMTQKPSMQPWQSRLQSRLCAYPQHTPSRSLRQAGSLLQQPGYSGLGSPTASSMQYQAAQSASQQQPLPAAASAQDAAFGVTTDTPGEWALKRPAEMTAEERLLYLRQLVKSEHDWDPGELKLEGHATTVRPICPACGGGSRLDDAFALTVQADDSGKATGVVWLCHRASCGYKGALSIHKRWAQQAVDRAAHSGGSVLYNQVSGQQQQQQQQQPSQLAAGAVAGNPPQQGQLLPQRPQQPLGAKFQELSPELVEWFGNRGISKATLDRNRVKMELKYCGATGKVEPQVAFPYYKDGAIVNVKYRALPKHFSQVKGGQQVLYGYDEAQVAQEVIFVEGEMDKLAVEEALMQAAAEDSDPGSKAQPGPTASSRRAAHVFVSPSGLRRAVVSVPSGAPSRSSRTASDNARKFQFLEHCSDMLRAASRVVLAVDSDGPGLILAEELARRIGREKCCAVTWPTSQETSMASAGPPPAAAADGDDDATSGGDDGGWARKDACEVLEKDGPLVLKAYIDAAKPLPVRGLHCFDDFWPQVYDLYLEGPKGLSWGVETGWASVDAIYKVVPGELSIVTGLSNSGKSEWLDALAVNLAMRYGWRFGVCSLENTPTEHGRKLMEKYTGKAFLKAPYAQGTVKMTYEDVIEGVQWIDEHFHLIRPPQDEMPSIDYILDKARAAVLRYGIHGLIIDPYNELDSRRPATMFETEYVSRMLTKIKRFAQHYDCHVWFVAHPRTQRGLGLGGGSSSLGPPSMYDISGSAHFINKADNGIVIHRPHTGTMAAAEGRDITQTQILVRKVRNKLAGRIGDATLAYDKATGRYKEVAA